MDYKILGKHIRDARTASDLKQSDIATMLGVTHANVSSWELGKSKIDIESLVKLSSLLGLRYEELLKLSIEDDKKAPTKAGEGKYKNIIALLDKLNDVAPEKILKVEGYIESLIESAGADKQINGHIA